MHNSEWGSFLVPFFTTPPLLHTQLTNGKHSIFKLQKSLTPIFSWITTHIHSRPHDPPFPLPCPPVDKGKTKTPTVHSLWQSHPFTLPYGSSALFPPSFGLMRQSHSRGQGLFPETVRAVDVARACRAASRGFQP